MNYSYQGQTATVLNENIFSLGCHDDCQINLNLTAIQMLSVPQTCNAIFHSGLSVFSPEMLAGFLLSNAGLKREGVGVTLKGK